MVFDQIHRNRLQTFVSNARTLLMEEFKRQLQNDYGLDPNAGIVTPLEKLQHLDDGRWETARILRATLEHYQAGSPGANEQSLLERIGREQAFTVLNRLAALRMAEARGLLLESVGAGYNSKGFQLYARLAGSGLGETGDAYRCYLFSVFDEFALDLAVLFDRFSPMGRLFPREGALLELLGLFNEPEISELWAEDETIGWIYQYFNSQEERKKMRKESSSPRNSRELAVRNQFFTPRYVVEFLTDNTLGRMWYEMTQRETGLKKSCQYLVRRPTEIFLGVGEEAPVQAGPEEELSQEELLKRPVNIAYRALKDPREIRMLDPACGSMHFGLYAFDLYERIYEEAWELEGQGRELLREDVALKPLRKSYDNKDDFCRDVPRLIVEYNIHGVDIDPRAVQIAGLSLWLRAQRSWQEKGLKPQQRPRIQHSNIVCAEPMPGEEELLNEFIEQQLSATPEQRLIGQLVHRVFEAMKLAGEAGSLLQIERSIDSDIQEAKRQWINQPKSEQLVLIDVNAEELKQQELSLAVAEITDMRFWLKVEDEIYNALKQYAERTEDGENFQRRLFVKDASRGFAFIDLCRKRYSVVLMNPPFGSGSMQTKTMLAKAYPRTKNDMYAAFVERGLQLLEVASNLGAITSRTGFFLSSFQKWREEILLKESQPTVFADFGLGVLDAAMVETAAYCLTKIVA